MRRRRAAEVPPALAAAGKEILAGRAVDLDQCVEIALANNLDIKVSQIDRRLASLDRKIAFSQFLPNVVGTFRYRSLDNRPTRRINEQFFQSSDRAVVDVNFEGQLPVFSPGVWFLYAARVRGEEIADDVYLRTKQLITLRVTSLYYGVLTYRQQQVYLDQSVVQATALLDETRAQARNGRATTSEVLNVELLVQSRRYEAGVNARAVLRTKAELLDTMGLSPLIDIRLSEQIPREPRRIDLAEQVTEALLSRPELRTADRTISIRKEEVKAAVAAFLPEFAGIADFGYTSNSFNKFATQFGLGAGGILQILDGFANVHRYDAALSRREQACLRRQQQCLTVMLEVVRADLVARDADARRQLATIAAAAAAETWRQTERKAAEGLVRTSARLEALVNRDRTRINRVVAIYRHQTALATLDDVVGTAR